MLRKCNSCQSWFPKTPDYFYRRSTGILSVQCKSCVTSQRRNYKQKVNKMETNSGKAMNKRVKDMDRDQRIEELEARYSEPTMVRKIVFASLLGHLRKEGLLLRPEECSICKRTCIPHAAHYDYEHWSHFKWCCVQCHNKHGREVDI